jgi:arylsulfatase A-like enzyme
MFVYYPMVLTHTPFTTTPDEPDAKGKVDQHKAMVRYADKMIGKVVDALDELKLRENTIVIVTTDNGTTPAITGLRLDHHVKGAKMQMVEAGTAIPFVVNCPSKVPAGVVTQALVDFTDVLQTFAELGGAKLPADCEIDGQSFAPLILGKKTDSPRGWILSMGGHPAAFDDGRVVPAQPYDDRVVRDGRWKLWIGEDREPVKLFDMQADPWEQQDQLGSYDEQARAARQRLLGLIRSLPEKDAIPQYTPNPPQKWDKYKIKP